MISALNAVAHSWRPQPCWCRKWCHRCWKWCRQRRHFPHFLSDQHQPLWFRELSQFPRDHNHRPTCDQSDFRVIICADREDRQKADLTISTKIPLIMLHNGYIRYRKSFQSLQCIKCLLFCLVQCHSVAMLPPSYMALFSSFFFLNKKLWTKLLGKVHLLFLFDKKQLKNFLHESRSKDWEGEPIFYFEIEINLRLFSKTSAGQKLKAIKLLRVLR